MATSRKTKQANATVSYGDIIRKSIAASLLIGLGDYVLLKLGSPLGPVLFAFGLLGVCILGANLFTGKCGFVLEDKIKPSVLITILITNLISGYLFGLLFSACDGGLIAAAQDKVASWDISWSFLIRSIMCGVIMYLAVAMYRKGSPLGIIYGIPLFIFCGFQHCIANIITLGVAQTFDWSIILAIVGNFAGSILMWCLCGDSLSSKK